LQYLNRIRLTEELNLIVYKHYEGYFVLAAVFPNTQPNRVSHLLCSLIFSIACSCNAAELPSLGVTKSVNGNVTNTQFFGGARANDREVFENQFDSFEQLTIAARLQLDPSHIGRIGNLYIIVAVGDNYFYRDSAGTYEIWDRQFDSLKPAALNKILSASEEISILEDTTIGRLALSGQRLSFYFAYAEQLNPTELYYNELPLQIAIADYNPLKVDAGDIQTLQISANDTSRAREIPLLIYLPESGKPRPLILFSHGLGGSLLTAVYLGEQWAARGYNVVFMQHPGSDEDILKDVPQSQLLSTLTAAASRANANARIQDVSSVIDQLDVWNTDPSNELFGRFNMALIAMSGHSFGARTTQGVSGEDVQFAFRDTRERRISVAMPLSGSSPSIENAMEIYKGVDIPWLLMTGTNDVAQVGGTTVEGRLAVFPALPAGAKYELVLFGGEHHAFTDRPILSSQSPRSPFHHEIIMALSTAFFDAWLSGFPDALTWLEGEGATNLLQPGDRWQFK
jgi:dienelactone hydrolase